MGAVRRRRDSLRWTNCAQFVPIPADADLRSGDQRAISSCTKRSNFAGVRSLLGGIDPPSSATFALTPGSSRDLSSAFASLARMGLRSALGRENFGPDTPKPASFTWDETPFTRFIDRKLSRDWLLSPMSIEASSAVLVFLFSLEDDIQTKANKNDVLGRGRVITLRATASGRTKQ
jgi:hypothetical protein